MSFLHTLKPEEREVLRRVVKKYTFVTTQKSFALTMRLTKLSLSIGPEMVERMIKFGKDHKVDQL